MPSQPPKLPGFRELFPEFVVPSQPQQPTNGRPAQTHGGGNHRPRNMTPAPIATTTRPPQANYQPVPTAPAGQRTVSNHTQAAPSPSRSQTSPPGGRTHTHDEKNYHCDRCPKHFSRPSALITHMNSHTGAKPYNCDFHGCDKVYSTKSNMRRHSHTHTTPEGTQFPSNSPRRT